jgi:exopolysaccharide biosynthesis WecB/TagA/CpsF family protein
VIDQGKRNILGVLVDAMDYEAAVARILGAARARQALGVAALAVHGLMIGVTDATQRYRLNHLDLVLPDGQPVRWGLNWLHRAGLADRVYGPTLMLKLCEGAAAENLPVYLYGSSPRVLDALCANLRRRFPGLAIAGAQPSRFRTVSAEEKHEIAARIAGSGAALVFAGLGCPRQEVWVYEHRGALSMPCVAVGAAFDFHAGTLAQAPAVVQRAGLEWLYRLAREPRRLWKRYALYNPMYAGLLALQAAGLARFEPENAVAPIQEVRYG